MGYGRVQRAAVESQVWGKVLAPPYLYSCENILVTALRLESPEFSPMRYEDTNPLPDSTDPYSALEGCLGRMFDLDMPTCSKFV